MKIDGITCIDKCATGEFLEVGKCKKCSLYIDNCLTCSSSIDCTTCDNSLLVNKAVFPNQCVTTCPKKTHLDGKFCYSDKLSYAQFRKDSKYYNKENPDIYSGESSPEFSSVVFPVRD